MASQQQATKNGQEEWEQQSALNELRTIGHPGTGRQALAHTPPAAALRPDEASFD
jgi:hypothetical protein